MDPLTRPQDVETALLRPLTDLEAQYMPGLIDQASSKLRAKLPNIDDRIALFDTTPTDPTAISPDTVQAVLAGVIKRYLVNPDGAVSRSRTDGPFANSVSFPASAQSARSAIQGELVITNDDLAQLSSGGTVRLPGSIKLKPALAPANIERCVYDGLTPTC